MFCPRSTSDWRWLDCRGVSGLVSNTMDAAGVDSKLASQISAGIDVVGGTALLFTPFAPVGASMIGSGVGSFAGGYISELRWKL